MLTVKQLTNIEKVKNILRETERERKREGEREREKGGEREREIHLGCICQSCLT